MMKYTEKEIREIKEYIKNTHRKESVRQFAERLGRSERSVRDKILDIKNKEKYKKRDISRSKKHWTEEEKEYLRINWGKSTIEKLSIYLKRTESSIKNKVRDLELGQRKIYYSCREVGHILGLSETTIIRYMRHGLLKYGKASTRIKTYSIKLEDLTEFMEQNQDKWDSRKLKYEPWLNVPDWYIQKKKKDEANEEKYINIIRWTSEETEKMLKLKEEGLTVPEISEIIGIPKEKIYNKLFSIKNKERRIAKKNIEKNKLYEVDFGVDEEERKKLVEYILNFDEIDINIIISIYLYKRPKKETAIRNKCCRSRVYGVLEKIRKYIERANL